MSGASAADFDADYRDAFCSGVAAGSNGTFSKKNVHITDVTDTTAVTDRRKLASDGVVVTFNLNLIIEKMKLTKENAFSTLSSKLKQSMTSSAMTSTMNSELASKKGGGAAPVGVSGFEASESDSSFTSLSSAVPSSAPTKAPFSDDDTVLPSWSVSVIIIGASLFLLVSIGVACNTFRNRGGSKEKDIAKNKKLNRVAVEPMPLSATNVTDKSKSIDIVDHSFLKDTSLLRDKPANSSEDESVSITIKPKVRAVVATAGFDIVCFSALMYCAYYVFLY
jgi:hypothetical protein